MMIDPEMRARVAFRKQLSDQQFGTEAAEVAIDLPLGEAYQLSKEAIAAALEMTRELVHGELSRSPSAAIVRALEHSSGPPRGRTASPAADPIEADGPESLPF